MQNSCAVCFLAVVFCLVVCGSASTKVSLGEATQEVGDAEEAVRTVCARAQTQFDNANQLLDKVESSKREATDAKVKSQEAPQDNSDAVGIANTIKILSDEVDKLYATEKQKLDNAVSRLKVLLPDAQKLNDKPDIKIELDTDSSDEYTETKGKAAALKVEATELNGRISAALELITGVESTADNMAEKAKEAQLKDSQVSTIVAVAKMKSMVENADGIILQTEEKEREVSGIVEKIQNDCTTEPTQSNEVIKEQCKIANDALKDATGAVDNAKRAKADIETQKDTADEALRKVKEENQEVSKAKQEVTAAEACVGAAQQSVLKLNEALQTAKDSVTKANGAKQNVKIALSTATTAARPERSVTNPKVIQLQDSVSADVNTIQTMMEKAEGTLQETQNHKEAVNGIVNAIMKQCKKGLIDSNEIVKKQCQSANDALTSASGALDKAKNAMAAMKEQKGRADTALENVQKPDTNLIKTEEEGNAAKTCITAVEQNLVQLNNALQTAKESVTKANDAKKEIKKALSTTTTAPSTVQATETEKTNHPVGQGTEPDPKDTTIQPTSKESPSQSNNSSEEIKNALSNNVQNVPTTALTGGKAPAPGAKNDSAMPVSVPLLVALIASAVLQ